MRKNEAILRTFRQVSMHFAEVFKELVPEGELGLMACLRCACGESADIDARHAGKGNLVMLRDTDMVGGSPHRQDADDVSLFRGVGMKVRLVTHRERALAHNPIHLRCCRCGLVAEARSIRRSLVVRKQWSRFH